MDDNDQFTKYLLKYEVVKSLGLYLRRVHDSPRFVEKSKYWITVTKFEAINTFSRFISLHLLETGKVGINRFICFPGHMLSRYHTQIHFRHAYVFNLLSLYSKEM